MFVLMTLQLYIKEIATNNIKHHPHLLTHFDSRFLSSLLFEAPLNGCATSITTQSALPCHKLHDVSFTQLQRKWRAIFLTQLCSGLYCFILSAFLKRRSFQDSANIRSKFPCDTNLNHWTQPQLFILCKGDSRQNFWSLSNFEYVLVATLRAHLNEIHQSNEWQTWDGDFRCSVQECCFTFDSRVGRKAHTDSRHVSLPVWISCPFKRRKDLTHCWRILYIRVQLGSYATIQGVVGFTGGKIIWPLIKQVMAIERIPQQFKLRLLDRWQGNVRL